MQPKHRVDKRNSIALHKLRVTAISAFVTHDIEGPARDCCLYSAI